MISTWRDPLPGGSSWVESWAALLCSWVLQDVAQARRLPPQAIALGEFGVKCNKGDVLAMGFQWDLLLRAMPPRDPQARRVFLEHCQTSEEGSEEDSEGSSTVLGKFGF